MRKRWIPFLKHAINRALGRFGYRVVKDSPDSPHVPWANFLDLARSYEHRLNQSGRRKTIPEREGRFRLLSDLAGTPPGEAYELIRTLAETADVEGEVCEFGVARGSTSALIANEIRDSPKTLHLFDSFRGLSRPTSEDVLKDDIESRGEMAAYEGAMASPEDYVRAKLKAVGFDKTRYVIHPGFVQDTLTSPEHLPTSVSFAYLDMDLYEPTALTLEWLDAVTSQGAVMFVDDYDFFSLGVKTAVDEFVARKGDGGSYELEVSDPALGHFAVIRKT